MTIKIGKYELKDWNSNEYGHYRTNLYPEVFCSDENRQAAPEILAIVKIEFLGKHIYKVSNDDFEVIKHEPLWYPKFQLKIAYLNNLYPILEYEKFEDCKQHIDEFLIRMSSLTAFI